MDTPHKFRVLVPSNEASLLTASGKIGPQPDTGLLGLHPERCYRSHLPSCIAELTFAYTFTPPSGWTGPGTVPNFFCLYDFFIVSAEIKAFFDKRLPGDFESVPVRLTKGKEGPAVPGYHAVKITRTIDCIDPERSFATPLTIGPKRSFSELTFRCELTDALAPDFANAPGNRYVSYPYLGGVNNIHILSERIAKDVSLFQPAFWPSVLLVRADFATELAQKCSGGATGSYFWVLDTEDVSGSWHKIRLLALH